MSGLGLYILQEIRFWIWLLTHKVSESISANKEDWPKLYPSHRAFGGKRRMEY